MLIFVYVDLFGLKSFCQYCILMPITVNHMQTINLEMGWWKGVIGNKDCILSLISIVTFIVMVSCSLAIEILLFLINQNQNLCCENWISRVLTLFWLGFVVFIELLPKKIKKQNFNQMFWWRQYFFSKNRQIKSILKNVVDDYPKIVL